MPLHIYNRYDVFAVFVCVFLYIVSFKIARLHAWTNRIQMFSLLIICIHMIYLFRRATAKLRGYPMLKPTYVGMLNWSLAMSVTFQKFHYLSHSQATGNNSIISGFLRLRSHKCVMHYSLFMLNGLLGMSMTFQSFIF